MHEDYLRAGATLIETNTFGANALRLEKYGLQGRVREINEAAVAWRARRSTRDRARTAYVAGAIGPSGYFLGEASPEDLARVHAALFAQARALVGAGVDALYVETMRQTEELRVAIDAAVEASREPGRAHPGHRVRVGRRARPHGRRHRRRRDRAADEGVGGRRRSASTAPTGR